MKIIESATNTRPMVTSETAAGHAGQPPAAGAVRIARYAAAVAGTVHAATRIGSSPTIRTKAGTISCQAHQTGGSAAGSATWVTTSACVTSITATVTAAIHGLRWPVATTAPATSRATVPAIIARPPTGDVARSVAPM